MASEEESKPMSKPNLVCDFCEKEFSIKSTLTRHYKNVHKKRPTNGSIVRQRFKCPFQCLDELSWHWQLIQHLKTKHSVDIPVEELEFASENDFMNWKYEMENETLSKYIKESSTKTQLDGTKKVYFLCHRSYTSRQRLLNDKERKRAFKAQGTKKTDKSCPSRIEVVFNKDLTLSAVFWKGHCGHTNDLGHLPLDKPTKDCLARKLRDGVSFERILYEVQSEGAEVTKRTSLLLRRDLHNIVRDYNIKLCINTKSVYNQKLANKARAVLDFIQKNQLNKNVYTLLEKSLDTSISICNNILSDSRTSSKFLCKEKINVNNHTEPQVRILSTKKKNKCVKRLKNLTYNESVNIIQGLQSGRKEIIHVHTGNDHTYNASFR